MSQDARFEDGREVPLNLGALDAEDLKVLSALVQDAVFPITEMRWLARERRFAVLLNRFRWEDAASAEARGRPVERVQSVLGVENVQRVASQGIDRTDKDTILSVLGLTFEADAPEGEGEGDVPPTSGALIMHLAGDGAIRLQVEALELRLKDVTRPYRAPSGRVPQHDL